MVKKIAVILSGSGVFDGSEIHEAVLTLYAIQKHGAQYQCFAPDRAQHHVVNHITGAEMPETRNILVESARIARGKVKPLSGFKAAEFDALVLPGGYGAAKNLCNFAFDNTHYSVHPEVEKALREMHALGKPIGALCISPVILAKLFDHAEITVGQDPGTIRAVEVAGAKHVATNHGEVVIDEKNNLFSTPCYMLDATLVDIQVGCENLIVKMLHTLNN